MREIKRIADDLGMAYIYAEFAKLNLHADGVDCFPLLVEVVATGGKYSIKHSPIIKASQQITICVLRPCPLDWDAEIGYILQDCINDGRRVLAKMVERGIDIDGDAVQFANVFDFMDKNLCGIRCTMTITDEGECSA